MCCYIQEADQEIAQKKQQQGRQDMSCVKCGEVREAEGSIVSITKQKGAMSWSSLYASIDRNLQSVLTTLPLLIPSIQPHHYGNWLDVSPFAS